MIEKNSGFIFRFPLDHNLGYGYAEILDSSDSNTWDYLAYVYNYFDYGEICNDISLLTNSGIFLGPLSLLSYPNIKGKKAWKLIGRNANFIKDFPPNKSNGKDKSIYDWSTLGLWRYFKGNDFRTFEEVDYEVVRYIEYVNLFTHKDCLPMKVTMKKLIEMGKKVGDYYDFSDFGTRNVFVQVINTYFSKEKVEELIKDLPPFSY